MLRNVNISLANFENAVLFVHVRHINFDMPVYQNICPAYLNRLKENYYIK